MNWEPPPLTIKKCMGAPFGTGADGYVIQEVSPYALRAIHSALRQTIAETITDTEAVPRAIQRWIVGLNQSVDITGSMSEAWLKDTHAMFSVEFFALADAYARQICEQHPRYLHHLADSLVLGSLKELPPEILYQHPSVLLQTLMPLAFSVEHQGSGLLTITWNPALFVGKLPPSLQEQGLTNLSTLLDHVFIQVPRFSGLAAASIKRQNSALGAVLWHISWQRPWQLPFGVGMGLGITLIVCLVALVVAPLGYLALLPLVFGALWELHNQRQPATPALSQQLARSAAQFHDLNAAEATLNNLTRTQARQTNDLFILREAILVISASPDQEKVVDNILHVMTEVLHLDRALVLLVEQDKARLRLGGVSHPPDDPADQLRLKNWLLDFDPTETLNQADPLLGAWLHGNSLFNPTPESYLNSRLNWVLSVLGFAEFYSVPVIQAGKMLAVVLVDNRFTNVPILPEDRNIIDALAANIAIMLENTRLFSLQDEELQKSVQELKILRQIDRELVDTLQIQGVLDLLMDWALRFTDALGAVITLIDSDESGRIAAFYGIRKEDLPGGSTNIPFSLAELGITGRAAQTATTQVVADIEQDADYLYLVADTRSTLAVPIRRQHRVIAVITLESHQPFTTEHIQFIERLAARAGVALENARLYTEMQQERDKLSAILTRTTDAVIVVDEQDRLLLINTAALHVFNLIGLPDDYIGRAFNAIFDGSPLAEFYRLVQGGSLDRDREVTLGAKSYHANAVRVENVGFTLLLHDVTPFVEVDRLKSELVQTVTHDLKNPLSVMRGYVDLIDMTQQLNERGRRYVQNIFQAVAGMQELIENLLDLARIESGLKLDWKIVDIGVLIDTIQEDLSLRTEEKGLRFIKKYAEPLPFAWGDERRIRQILANLMSNAVKYTLSEGDLLVQVQVLDEMMRISIKDQGIGIPQEELFTIWERFVRVRSEETQNIEGTGLGLTIVKTLVEAHGGQVGVESKLNDGSTFWFTLPLPPKSES